MKLSFWTLGMPPWPTTEVATRASSLGYDGVDLRCAPNGNLSVESSDEELQTIRQVFAESGVELPCLLGYNRGGHDGEKVDWDVVEGELIDLARVAGKLGSSQMRVQVTRPAESWSWNWDDYLDKLGAASLNAVKQTPGLTAVFENHVGSASALQLLQMVEAKGDDRLGVVFSPDHSIVMQEDSVDLAERYAPAIRQVCLADRRPVQDNLGDFDGRYYYVRYETCLMGEGLVPTSRILDTLARKGYDGYVALKWEKSDSFGHHLPSGETALSQYIEYMRGLGFTKS